MFAYIKGKLESKLNNYIVIDVGGIGYKVFMSESNIERLGELGEIVKVHTYYYVREDNISLYGFITSEELRMFELLIGVSGIGAKSAITMLSNISPSSFALAVISNDISQLIKIQGIGKKTAQRIILELKENNFILLIIGSIAFNCFSFNLYFNNSFEFLKLILFSRINFKVSISYSIISYIEEILFISLLYELFSILLIKHFSNKIKKLLYFINLFVSKL